MKSSDNQSQNIKKEVKESTSQEGATIVENLGT